MSFVHYNNAYVTTYLNYDTIWIDILSDAMPPCGLIGEPPLILGGQNLSCVN
jgi:hypothetical protein